jgi:hypothetical protein
VLYRQHGANNIGAKRYSAKYFLDRVMKIGDSIESNKKIIYQGKDFYYIYDDLLTKEQKEVICNFFLKKLKLLCYILKSLFT